MKDPWCVTAILIASMGLSGVAEPEIAEEHPLYTDHAARGVELRVWGMQWREANGHLYLNEDNRGKPWAGVNLSFAGAAGPALTLTDDWAAFGHVRFRINGLSDAYGNIGAPCGFQFRLAGIGRYERVSGSFYQGGPIDADPETWHTVQIPLTHFGVKPGARIDGISLQCKGQPKNAFAVDGFALVRLTGPAPAAAERTAGDVAQPWVTWPEYEALPDPLKVDRRPPRLQDGKFVTADGRRTFIISPWGQEDQRLALGLKRDGWVVPHYDLYDPAAQGWVYEQPLNGANMARLGFNCFAGHMHPGPFWKAIGYDKTPSGNFTEADFLEFVRGMKVPFYVDMVCFPWTLGKPGTDKKTNLDPALLHDGRHHWTPYRIIGEGREAWLTMWRTYAQRYKDAGANVIFYEFMNEPAYLATTPDHRAEFVDWLRRRYGTLAAVNRTWSTNYASWEQVRDFKTLSDHAGLFFDYDEYLGDRFADLIAAGVEAIEAITPGVPAAVQPLGDCSLEPGEAVYLAKLIPRQRAVLTPTGGGRWTSSIGNRSPQPHTLECGVAAAPLDQDLMLAMAGAKMLFDNEMYLEGQTRKDTRNRWWKHVIGGLDGASLFSWSKRGWAWHKGRENLVREADHFPWSALIPYARRADALRGTLDFAMEMERVGEYVLPKPWGPPPKIGLLYSWANARRPRWDKHLRNKAGHYHAALRYLHWNAGVVPAHMAEPRRLAAYEMLVAGGIEHAEPELVDALTAYVNGGGTLVVGEGRLDRDLYGNPLETEALLGVRFKAAIPGPIGRLVYAGLDEFAPLPGDVTARAGGCEVEPLPGTQVLCKDDAGRAMVTRHVLGRGNVYYVAADLVGYPLAKLLAGIRQGAGSRAALRITAEGSGELAPNLLVSRRSYASHHALLMRNGDGFPKHARVRIGDLDGAWHVTDPLAGKAFVANGGARQWTAQRLREEGVSVCLSGGDYGLLLLTRAPWTRTALADTDAAASAALFRAEQARWEAGRAGKSHFACDPSRVVYVDLRGAANATKDDVVADAARRWLGFPFTEPLVRTFAGVPFQIVRWDHNDGKGYVAVRGRAAAQHPAAVRDIPVGTTAARLFLLHTCGAGKAGEALGHYVVRYADGTAAKLPIVIGESIAPLDERAAGQGGPLATALVTSSQAAWHVYRWENPRPEAAIRALDLVAAPEAPDSVVLVAVTAER
ncbi:MAG: beta-galactosidase [Kiritimatiellae bacterium]|nr:beta-galactosidase [Kiritimatiellia bacterium]